MPDMKDEKVEVSQEKKVSVDNEGKTPELTVEKETTVAPTKDKTTDDSPKPEDISDILELLNVIQEQLGQGKLTEIPENLQGALRYMFNGMLFVKQMFEDPKFMAIVDDMYDQKEDGMTPDIDVAIVRTRDMGKLQELADSEDYASVQTELRSNLDAQKAATEDEALMEENFKKSQESLAAYAEKMGYSEEESTVLFNEYMEWVKASADGVMDEKEWERVDKARNYDNDIQALSEQIPSEESSKEVLPDQASVESAMQKPKPTAPSGPVNKPGLGSMSAYDSVSTNITDVGKRRRSV